MMSMLTFPALAIEASEIRVIENNHSVVTPAQNTCCSSMSVTSVLAAVTCWRNARTGRCDMHTRTYNRICTSCRTFHGNIFRNTAGCNRIMT